MASLTMTRRTFAKVAAATAAAAGLGAGATGTALAETDAGPEKGNEVKRIRRGGRARGSPNRRSSAQDRWAHRSGTSRS